MNTRGSAGGLAAGALAFAVAAGTACIGGTAAQALPTTWVLQNATLDDRGSASGLFTIGPYGYLTAPGSITTTAGSLLGGHVYSYSDPTNILPSSPPPFGVEFHSATYNLTLHIEFQNSLELTGVNPIILASSWECASFSCPGPDTGNPGANTRYFTAGSAVAAPEPRSLSLAAPEPGSLSLLALGAAGVLAARRRRSARG